MSRPLPEPTEADSFGQRLPHRCIAFRPRGFAPPRRFTPGHGVRACCIPEPDVRFDVCADHRLDTPEGGQTGQAGFRHRVSHPSKTSPRQQPYRIAAAVALLPFTGDAHLRGGWRPSVGLDVVTRARSEEHRLGLGHRPSRCSGSHRRSHCLELRRVEPLGHEDRETAWMLFHTGLPRRGRSHQARTRSHTARTVPGGSEPALLLATEVVGGLCLLPAGAVVQARTWLRLQRSRRADPPREEGRSDS
jgi:hypothetical protein